MVAAVLGVVAYFAGKASYKIFSIILGFGAVLSLITFIRNPSMSLPDLPDNIPLPGGK